LSSPSTENKLLWLKVTPSNAKEKSKGIDISTFRCSWIESRRPLSNYKQPET
jgi:hypothetical protein